MARYLTAGPVKWGMCCIRSRRAIVQNGIDAAGLTHELFQRHSALDFKADPQLLMFTSPPLDRAESGAPEQDIHETDGFDRLVPVLHGRILGVPV